MPGSGYIYVLENKSFPDLVKIGMTTQISVEKRVSQMSTGVPTPFKISFDAYVTNPQKLEKKLHSHFDEYRYSKNREWFDLTVDEVIEAVHALDAEAQYDSRVYSSIADYVEFRSELENRKVGGIVTMTYLIMFFITYLVLADGSAELAFLAIASLFVIGPVLGWTFKGLNRNLFYGRELREKRENIALEYGVQAEDILKRESEYHIESKRQLKRYIREMRQSIKR